MGKKDAEPRRTASDFFVRYVFFMEMKTRALGQNSVLPREGGLMGMGSDVGLDDAVRPLGMKPSVGGPVDDRRRREAEADPNGGQPRFLGAILDGVNDAVQGLTWSHSRGSQLTIGDVIAFKSHRTPLCGVELIDDGRLIGRHRLSDGAKRIRQSLVVRLLRKGLCPVHAEIEMASSVVQLIHFT